MISEKIKTYRKELGLTQEELAQHLGVTKSTIIHWEKAESKPDTDSIIKLAKLFAVSTDYLLGFETTGLDKIEILRKAVKEAGLMTGNDFTKEEFEKALQIIEVLREK